MSGITPCNLLGPTAPLRPDAAQPQGDAGALPLEPARAERLKAAIAAGQYPVDAAKLAERLMALGLFSAEPK